LITIVAASLAAIVCTRHAKQHEFRNKITALANELSTHQSNKEELRRLLTEPRFQDLVLREDSPNEWLVETPIEFGATNWVLYLDFNDSTIVEVRVRTADNENAHPREAPADKSFLPSR